MYSEHQVKTWIAERLPKGVKSLTTSIRNSKDIQQALYEYTKSFDELSFSARANILHNGGRPTCTVCGSYTYFNRNRWEFAETCSVKCAANNQRRNDQIKDTLIERYGVDNYSKSSEFKESLKNHNIEKYGVEHYFQSNDYQEKAKETMQERYGVDHFTLSNEFKTKAKETCNVKYGADHHMKSEDVKNKVRKTFIETYGVDHPMKTLEVFEKQQKNSYYFKDYTMPSGKVVRIQGYEDKALDELLATYHEDDLIISNKEIFEKFGSFEYDLDGKTHRYYPDIYLIPKDMFIEVKSDRTFAVSKKKNLLKRDSVLEKGHGFQFWIYGRKGKKTI